MTKYFLSCLLILSSILSKAQIPKTNLVEHFTNSNCGICAANNPAIYSTLNANPNVLHITYHPSSPYPTCFFSMQNVSENDARTNFYGIYGGTPKLIVNGSLTPTANLAGSLSTLSSGMTAFEVRSIQKFIGADSVELSLVIKKVATDTTQTALLFVGALEDSIFQSTGNGESLHQDVFRKSLSSATGNQINLPAVVNDSMQWSFGYKILPSWNKQRMNCLVILQKLDSKELINAALSENEEASPTKTIDILKEEISIYPNPAKNSIYIKTAHQFSDIQLVDVLGRTVLRRTFDSPQVDIHSLPAGIYLVELFGREKKFTFTLVKE